MGNNQKGFTLIEIMLVVIIIGTLAAMVMPRLVGQSKKAFIKRSRADIATISTALQRYEMDNGFFPNQQQGLQALMEKPSSSPVPINWDGPYLDNAPKDPWNNAYHYRNPPQERTHDFDLYSSGPDTKEGTEDDITNWGK